MMILAWGASAIDAVAEDGVDLSKPLFIAAGRAMCGSSSDVRASLAGAPSDCSQASHAIPVITMSNNGIGGIYQVRILNDPAGTVVWVPLTSLTNAAPHP